MEKTLFFFFHWLYFGYLGCCWAVVVVFVFVLFFVVVVLGGVTMLQVYFEA